MSWSGFYSAACVEAATFLEIRPEACYFQALAQPEPSLFEQIDDEAEARALDEA